MARYALPTDETNRKYYTTDCTTDALSSDLNTKNHVILLRETISPSNHQHYINLLWQNSTKAQWCLTITGVVGNESTAAIYTTLYMMTNKLTFVTATR